MANWAINGVVTSRVAVMAKCDMLPSPMVNPSTMKASSTSTFAPVRTFCTRATRCTPKMFRTVKTATSAAGHGLRSAQPDGPFARADDHRSVLLAQGREEVPQVFGKRQRGRGDGRGESGEERSPAGHESPGGAEGARQVDVFAAGAGEVDAQLGITDRAQERARCRRPPRSENQIGRAEIAGQESGAGEDPRADHVGDHQRRRADQAQLAEKSGFAGGHYYILRVARRLGLRAVTFFVFFAAAAGAGIVAARLSRAARRSLRLFFVLWASDSSAAQTRIEPVQPQALVEGEHHQLRLAARQIRKRVDLAQHAADPAARGLARHGQRVGEQRVLAKIFQIVVAVEIAGDLVGVAR